MKKEEKKVRGDRRRSRAFLELFAVLVLAFFVYILSSYFDLLEQIVLVSNKYEQLELDEIITVLIFLAFAMLFFSLRRWVESRRAEMVLLQRNKDLEKALVEVKQLQGIIPICSVCKKIRDDKGYWQQVEAYVSEHTEAQFSHGVCPDCMKKLYSDIVPHMPGGEEEPVQ